MSSRGLRFVIILLLLIGLVILGLLSKQILQSLLNKNPKPTFLSKENLSQPKKEIKSSFEAAKLRYPNASTEELILLSMNSTDAAHTLKPEYVNAARAAAQKVQEIELNNCQPSVKVAEFNQGIKIKFINLDLIEHSLRFTRKNYKIASKSGTLLIEPNTTEPNGVFGYYCDSVLSGVIYIP